MDQENPYASPQYLDAPVGVVPGDAVPVKADPLVNWRWGDYVLLPREGTLPRLCVRCGVPTDQPLRRNRVQWCNPWILLTIVLGVWICLILALVLQKKGIVFFALCEKHARARRRWIAAAWGIVILGIAQLVTFFAFAGAKGPDWADFMLLTGIGTIVIGTSFGMFGSRTLQVKRIDKRTIWLKRLPPGFYVHLAQLPSVNGRTPIIPDVK